MRTAGRFGSVIPHKVNGRQRGWRAKYNSPLGHDKEVTKSFRNRGDAEAWLNQERRLVEDHYAGRAVWTPPRQREEARRRALEQARMPFEEYATQYVLTHRKEDGTDLEGSSRRKLEEYLGHLLDAFRDKTLADITTTDVAQWLNDSDFGPYPLRKSYQLLKAVMRKAVDEGVIDKNPCTMTAPRLPQSKQAQIPPATAEELRIIYENMPEELRIMVYLGAIFDMRIGEICALQRRDIDLKQGVIHIRHSYDYTTKGIKATKTTASTANQPIPEAVRPYLERALALIGDAPDTQLLQSAQGHNRPCPPGRIRDWFDKAKIPAGRPDLHVHTLRKTAISAAVDGGAGIKETMKYGRHVDVRTSIERYQDVGSESRQRQIAGNVAARLLPAKRGREEIQREIEETRRRLAQLEQELGRYE